VYTCQQWNDGLEGLPNDSRSCHRARSGFGVTCGCPVYGDPCTICKGGALMDKPNKEFVATVGAEAIHELFLDAAGDVSFTCGSAEKALSALYRQGESKCYWNQLLHGQACGCPDNSEIITLGWTQRGSGILSLSGSLLIIVSIITKPLNVRWSPYNQIVLGISFFDSLSSIAYIIGTAFTPMELALPGSIRNVASYMWLSSLAIPNWYRIHLLQRPSPDLFPTCCQVQLDSEEIQQSCKMGPRGCCRPWLDHVICCDPVCPTRLEMVLP